jgi:hypothetical protein
VRAGYGDVRLTGLIVATGLGTGISTPARGPSMSRFLSCARVEACWRTELLGPKVHRSKRHGDVSALCDRGVRDDAVLVWCWMRSGGCCYARVEIGQACRRRAGLAQAALRRSGARQCICSKHN